MLDIDGFVKILKEKGIKYKLRGNKYWRRIEITNNGEITNMFIWGYDRAHSIDNLPPQKIIIESYLVRGMDVCIKPVKEENIYAVYLELSDGEIIRVDENSASLINTPLVYKVNLAYDFLREFVERMSRW